MNPKRILILGIILLTPLFCLGSSIEINHTYSIFEFTQILGKNKWITALLAFLGGFLGLHRWYMGHYKAGTFYTLCFLLILSAISFVGTGLLIFPIIFLLLLLAYIASEVVMRLKGFKPYKRYIKPIQLMILALAYIPLITSLFWVSLVIAFSGYSVYLILFTSMFSLFSFFLAFRYAISSKREFIERFYKNRSIWH